MFRHLKITYRFVLATAIAVSLVFSLIFLLAQRGAVDMFDQLEQAELNGIVTNVVAQIEADGLRAQAMAAVVASMPQIREAFAAGDRSTLIAYFGEGFEALKRQYGVVQFQFHQPPARSFLRLHKLEKFGDDLASFRNTVVESNRDRVGIHGLETGVAGLGIRGIVPISSGGAHVGTVEFGLSLGQTFIARVAEVYGIDMAIHVQRESRLELLGSSRADSALIDDTDLARVTQQAGVFAKTQLAQTPVAVYARALLDYSGKQIGVISIAKDRSAYQAQLSSIVTNVSLMALLATLALVGMIWLIARSVVTPLSQTKTSMEAIAYGTGDLTARLDSAGNDEISKLAIAYNAFVSKLETTINSVVTTTNELALMVSGFSDVSERTSAGTKRQQQQVVQVATAMTEMSATVHEVAQNTVNTADAARQVDLQSNTGQEVVRTAMESINRLAEAVGSAVERIRLVEQDSQRIGSVLDVIRGIAEQTNLLALNAAIEAARAGEQGRGFAVVADEVRTLAQRTQQSTSEIQEMIESLQSGVESTVVVLENSKRQATDSVDQSAQAHEALVAINQSIDAITAMSAQIATAAEEQSAVAEDINRSIVEITQVAEVTSADAHQSVTETEHLASAVDRLVTLMGQFRTGSQHANELSRAKSAHLAWKGKVRGFLDGGTALDENVAFSHHACSLGKWYDSVGLAEFGHLPEATAIERPHRELHETIHRVVDLKRRGDANAAEAEYLKVGPLSQKIVDLITALERRI